MIFILLLQEANLLINTILFVLRIHKICRPQSLRSLLAFQHDDQLRLLARRHLLSGFISVLNTLKTLRMPSNVPGLLQICNYGCWVASLNLANEIKREFIRKLKTV